MSSSRRPETSSKGRSNEKAKSKDRVSVFSRLGIKGPSSGSTSSTTKVERTHQTPTCRQWLENGHCTYGSKCKSASTHSPKKLLKRPNTTKVPKDSKGEKRSPNVPGDVDWSKWDEKNLDREDERSLEKKRQLLERELAKQLAEEDKKSAGGRDFGPPPVKKLKTGIVDKRPNSSSSSSSGSSSSSSSGSWDSSSETSSESDNQRSSKVVEKKKVARRSNSEDSKKTMTSKESSSSSSTKIQALPNPENPRRLIPTTGKLTKLKTTAKVGVKRPHSPTDVKRVKKRLSSNKSPHDRATVSHKAPKETVTASRSWKGKRSRDSSIRRSLSPTRPVTSESRTKLKKVVKSGVKRSLSQDRRRQSPGRPLSKRSSHSPTQRRRPPSPSKSRPSGARGISRERDHRPLHPRDDPRDIRDARESLEQRDIRDIRDSRDSRLPRDVRNFRGEREVRDGHHRDVRDVRRDEVFRVKHDRDRKTTPQNPSRLQPGGHRDGWNRYPTIQSERDDRGHKSPSTRDLGISSMRSSDPRKIRESSGDIRHGGFRDKGKMREGNRSPRDQILHPDPYRHKMRDHDHSPRDRLTNPDNRDPMNQDLSGSLKRDRGSSEFTQKQTPPFDRHGGHYNRRESGSHDGPFLSSNQLNKSDNLNSPKRGDTNPRKWAPDTMGVSGQQIRDSSLRPTTLLSPTDKRNPDGLQEDSGLPSKSIAKSPLPPSHDVVDKQEYFSDLEINDSDEEILNKLNPNDNEEGQYPTSNDVIDDETEEGEVGAVESRSSSRKSTLNDVLGISESGSKTERANDLLEGISDEDLETCEEDEKTHIADALGVDWSMLMSNKKELENHASTDIKKRMSVISIFNRIGLSKKYLGNFYDEVVSEINSKAEEGEKLELLDDIGGLHQRMLNLREKRRKLFSSSGPYVIPHKVDLII